MAILTRVVQKIFGSTGAASNFGQIGSQTAGSPVNTKDLDTIQALAAYLAGLQAITNSNEPYLEDINALYLLITSQIKYLFQNGIPEWSTDEPYYNLISFVQVNGVVYQSIDGTSGTPNSGNAPASSPTKWRNVDPYTIGAALTSEISRATTAEGLLAPKANPTFTGHVTVPTPTNTGDAATKNYVDTAVNTSNPQAQQAVEDAGITWDPSDNYMLSKAIIADSHPVGALVESEIELTPVILSAARSTAHPAYPKYLPVIKRYDADHTITSAMASKLVTAYRAELTQINVAGVIKSSWTGTVSGSVITFAANASNLALVTMFANNALANGFIQTQDPNFTALFTGATKTINVNGTDYTVVGANPGAYTLTVTGSPTTGSQTCQVFTYRISGSTDSIMLGRIPGFVNVTAWDYDGEIVAGWLKMDRGQRHYHASLSSNFATAASIVPLAGGAVNVYCGAGASATTGAQTSDGLNGATRTGKTNDARSYGKFQYTWAGVLEA
jgi:hypothetical protein